MSAGAKLPARHSILSLPRRPFTLLPVEREEAIKQIQESCKEIALQFMKIHPAVPGIQDEETQTDCLKSLHAMTTELETIKKKLIRLQKRDDSAEL